MPTTDNPRDPRLTHGTDTEPVPQAQAYLVLSAEERERGFVRPVRFTYRHDLCRQTTTMSRDIAETYARDPKFYGATYCVRCRKHLPVTEFRWVADDSVVGS